MANEYKHEIDASFKEEETAWKEIQGMLSANCKKGFMKRKVISVEKCMPHARTLYVFFKSITQDIKQAQDKKAIVRIKKKIQFLKQKATEVKRILEQANPDYEGEVLSEGTRIVENLCHAKRHGELREKLASLSSPPFIFLPREKTIKEHYLFLVGKVDDFLQKTCVALEKELAQCEKDKIKIEVRFDPSCLPTIKDLMDKLIVEEVAQNQRKEYAYSGELLEILCSIPGCLQDANVRREIFSVVESIVRMKGDLLQTQEETQIREKERLDSGVKEAQSACSLLDIMHKEAALAEKASIQKLKKEIDAAKEKAQAAKGAWITKKEKLEQARDKTNAVLEAQQEGFEMLDAKEEEAVQVRPKEQEGKEHEALQQVAYPSAEVAVLPQKKQKKKRSKPTRTVALEEIEKKEDAEEIERQLATTQIFRDMRQRFQGIQQEPPEEKKLREAAQSALKEKSEEREKLEAKKKKQRAKREALRTSCVPLEEADAAEKQAKEETRAAKEAYRVAKQAVDEKVALHMDSYTVVAAEQAKRAVEKEEASEKLHAAERALENFQEQLVAQENISPTQEGEDILHTYVSAIAAEITQLYPGIHASLEKIKASLQRKQEEKAKKVAFEFSLRQLKEALIEVVQQENAQNKPYPYSKELLAQLFALPHSKEMARLMREVRQLQASSSAAQEAVKMAEGRLQELRMQKLRLEDEKRRVESDVQDCLYHLENASEVAAQAEGKWEQVCIEVEEKKEAVEMAEILLEKAHIALNRIKIQKQEAYAVIALAQDNPSQSDIERAQVEITAAQVALPEAEKALSKAQAALLEAQAAFAAVQKISQKAHREYMACKKVQERWEMRVQEKETQEAVEKKAQDLQKLEIALCKKSQALELAEVHFGEKKEAAEKMMAVPDAHPMSPAQKEVAELAALVHACTIAKISVQTLYPDAAYDFVEISALERELEEKTTALAKAQYLTGSLSLQEEEIIQNIKQVMDAAMFQEHMGGCSLPKKHSVIWLLLEILNGIVLNQLQENPPLMQRMFSEIQLFCDQQTELDRIGLRKSMDVLPVEENIAEKKRHIAKLEALDNVYQKMILLFDGLVSPLQLSPGLEGKVTHIIEQESAVLRVLEENKEALKYQEKRQALDQDFQRVDIPVERNRFLSSSLQNQNVSADFVPCRR